LAEKVVFGGADRADYDAFVSRVRRLTGIDLAQYREQQMARRLWAQVEKAGLTSFSEYSALLEKDGEEISRLLDRLTINVSEMFRDPERWKALGEQIAPSLMRTGKELRVWSAGCSCGAEPYSIAMALSEIGARFRILATDIDTKMLARAAEARYSEVEIRSLPQGMRKRYLVRQADGRWEVDPKLVKQVEFKKHDLLREPFEADFDLIVCRNVVIYFTDSAKSALFARLAEALRPGGALFVGGSERIAASEKLGLETTGPCFYVKREERDRTITTRGRLAA
jgi:chemotaxis protein methyltransferase CheR